MTLSSRINDTNASPWVIEEIRKLEAERDALAAHIASPVIGEAIDALGHASHWQEQEELQEWAASAPDLSLAHLKAQWQAELEGLQAERDALAAHVQSLQKALEYSDSYLSANKLNFIAHGSKAHSEMRYALDSSSTTSLARLKAQWQAELEGLQAERDALAAHVERIKAEYGVGAPLGRLERIGAVLRESPATSLTRRDAEQQKIGAASFKAMLQEASVLAVRVHAEGVHAVWLRRQAEEVGNAQADPDTSLTRLKAQPEREGREAYRTGKGISDNPYVNSSQPGAEAYQWHAGYKDQRDEDLQADPDTSL